MSAVIKVIMAIITVALLGGGAYYLYQHQTNTKNIKSTDISNQTIAPNTIDFTDSGFSPETITVKAGTVVTVVNQSSAALQFESDPHPTHTNETELNIGVVEQGQSKTFVVTKNGTWGYHNHLDPSQTGSIVVN